MCYVVYSLPKPHLFIPENPFVHQLWLAVHLRHEVHQVQNLGLKVDARCDFDQVNTVCTQFEDCTLCNVHNRLAGAAGIITGEGNLFHFFYELAAAAFLQNLQLTVGNGSLEAACRKGTAEENLLGILGNINEFVSYSVLCN